MTEDEHNYGESGVLPSTTDEPTAAHFDQPDWFKTAVFYEVLVRSFKDSNGDGVGDFRGLTEKLDYLHWLGVDCLWVPPFFSSPLRDGGYDISDYTNILPEAGTVEDFHHFLDEAHKRDIRVIIDFVMNHTSDQHPWFQASREDPDGPYGDFYVWSDTDELYEEARVIFVDTEPSNWTWDPVRQQYYWHRFFSHQPDLNFDNPKVMEAMLEAMTFWLDMGLDGFRLDAVPYLYERPGTNGENLPETHEALRQVRSFVDEHYPGRVLLAEANQWPSDVVDYFGGKRDPDSGEYLSAGDECHMCFHFPVMPRIFMAVRRENRFPISEILEQTPAIPDGCQWGIFLRNHDELTLEMVNDEERDYMWDEYAKDPRMKANIGIRRRLAPLLDNDTNRMELFTALLLSLPGSPVLYYGDEIGMGDNIWLGDRDGVRTPMQWTPDRNAGFSIATPGKLHLPPIQDPVFGYQRVNVETELDNSSSLLHWTRRMIQARKQHPCFGLGEFTDLGGSNPSVLSYVREHVDEDGNTDTVLCVNNLSRFPQPVELDLRRWEGVRPVELLGGVRFPQIGELPYLLTLGGYGFYWIRLPAPPIDDAGGARHERASADDGVPRRGPLVRRARAGSTTWSTSQRVGILPGPPPVTIDIITVEYADDAGGEPTTERYQMPLSHYPDEQGRIHHAYLGPHTDETLGDVHTYDAVHDREAMAVYLDAFAAHPAGQPQSYGGVTFHRVAGYDLDTDAHSTLFSGEQSNSSVAFGEDSLMKVFRKVTPGRNPDIEIHRALTEADNPNIAHSTAGSRPSEDDLAMLQQFLRTASDGWDLALASARNLFAEADLHADEVGGDFAGEAHRLGVAVSEVHEVLREHFDTETYDGAAAAEAMRRRLDAAAAVGAGARRARRRAGRRCSPASPTPRASRRSASTATSTSARRCAPPRAGSWSTSRASPRSRWPSASSPTPPGATSPACCAPSTTPRSRWSRTCTPPTSPARRSPTARPSGSSATATAFLDGYVERRVEAGGGPLSADEQALIDAYEADKAVYEVLYEARNRPTWLDIPLGAIERIGARHDHEPSPTIGEIDLHLINEGRHEQLWQALGAHVRRRRHHASASGHPTPMEVQVRGDFNSWDGSRSPLGQVGASGVWQAFVPGRRPGDGYKFHIRGADGVWRDKADPMAYLHRGPAGDRVARLPRARTRVDRRRVDGPSARAVTRPTSSRCRSTRCTSARGSGTRAPVPTATTTSSSTSCPTSSRWASPTSSSCP